MRSSRYIWRSIGFIAVLSTLIFVYGFIYAVQDILNPRASLPPEASDSQSEGAERLTDDEIRIVALGDSLTKGTGDQTGKGYVLTTKEMLEQITDKPVFLLGNYAVNGYRTDQLLKDLDSSKTVVETLKKANLIVLTIGGNDLFQLARTELDLTAEVNPDALYERLPEASKRLEQILTRLSQLNPDAAIIFIGLYNPFMDLDETNESSLIIQEFNHKAFEVTNRYPQMTLVPTFDLFDLNHSKYIYTDHFHPNADGYRRIAERIVQALE